MGRRGARWRVLALAAAGAACTGTAVETAPERPVAPVRADTPTGRDANRGHWVPGERMMWHLSFKGIPLVRAMLAVGKPGLLDGRRTIIVKTRLEPMSVVAAMVDFRIEMQSWIDTALHRPDRLEFYARVKDDEENRGVVWFRDGEIVTRLERTNRAPRTRTKKLPGGGRTHDVHTLLSVLRGWTPKAGEHARLVHFDDDKLRRHVVRLTRYELFDSEPLGRVPAARIDGVISLRSGSNGRPYTVWISDDARRVPLRIEMPTRHGPVSLDLVEYDDPRRRP